jgi:hypothetical protein
MPDADALFLLPSAVRRDPRIDAWFDLTDPFRLMVQPWFERMRACGDDVRETLHDGCPTACVGAAAFANVGAYSAHASVGFFHGAALPDPAGLLEGTGKRMRHVKLRAGAELDEAALADLITAAYEDFQRRLRLEAGRDHERGEKALSRIHRATRNEQESGAEGGPPAGS